MVKAYSSFREFYPYYLSEHNHPVCRGLHYIGCSLTIVLLLFTLFTKSYPLLWLLPLVGYGFAWMGHFIFEKNRPATFQYPLYSLLGDWVMYKDFLLSLISRKK